MLYYLDTNSSVPFYSNNVELTPTLATANGLSLTNCFNLPALVMHTFIIKSKRALINSEA